MKDFNYFDDEALFTGINAAWNQIEQSTINKYCDSMPKRLQSLQSSKGEMKEF